jgi:hypothetical protein
MSTDLLLLWGLIGLLGNRKSMPNRQVATNNVHPCAKHQTCVLSVTSNPERRKIKPNTKFGVLTAVCDAVSLVLCFPMFRTIVLPSSSGPEDEGNKIHRKVGHYRTRDTASHATRGEHSKVIESELPAVGQHSGTAINLTVHNDWLQRTWPLAKCLYGSRR